MRRTAEVTAWMLMLTLGGATWLNPRPALATGAIVTHPGVTPSDVSVRTAMAVGPAGNTRWSKLTVSGAGDSVLWLVPVPSGAILDWTADDWLSALDDASAPRVLPPTMTTSCAAATTPTRAATLGETGVTGARGPVKIHASAADVTSYAQSLGFTLSTPIADEMGQEFAAGRAVASVIVEGDSNGRPISSPTLRAVRVDPRIPLAATGSPSAPVRVTAFVLTAGHVALPGGTDAVPAESTWGVGGSNYAADRATRLAAGGGEVWLRESAGHAAIFDGHASGTGLVVPSVTSLYFASIPGVPSCASSATSVGGASAATGSLCPTGALGAVPGGVACTPTTNTIDVNSFLCGPYDDLALALGGAIPRNAILTRFAGYVRPGALGRNLSLSPTAANELPVISTARAFEPCNIERPGGAPPSATPSTGSSRGGQRQRLHDHDGWLRSKPDEHHDLRSSGRPVRL